MSEVTTEQVLGDRYRLTERIAGGGMGEVWRAFDEVLGREVAVKVLRREYADDPTFLARFHAEARHAATLSHNGVAAVYDFGSGDAPEGGSPYLVMELVPGEPLSALVAREGALPPRQVLEIVGQAAYALQAAHDAGVIHRDVKPGNILITADGTVKLTDFGISRATNSVPLTQTGTIMGTAHYISPEQASGTSVSPASDIYSLGIVAYECLTGRRPFAGDTPVSVALAHVREQPPDLPDTIPLSVRALVMRLLAKDPAERPSSAGQVGRLALELAVAPGLTAAPTAGPPPTGPRTDPGFRVPPPGSRPRWPLLAATVAAVVLVLLLARACTGPGDPTTTAADSRGQSASKVVLVSAADYLGRPVAEARAELQRDGLVVDVVRSHGGGAVGTVKGVAPTGELSAGSTVRLDVVAAQPPRSEDRGEDEGPGKGRGKGHGKGKDD